MALAQIATQFVSLATLAVMMRLLSPEAYGLVGMVLPLVMLLRILATLGLNVATVQRPTLSDAQASSLFWLTLGLGMAAALVAAALAPGMARFYGEPHLTPLTLALGGTALAAALGSQHQALLERKLQLGRLSACRLAALACGSGAAIAAARAGWGVWSLVVQQYAELVALALAVWLAEPWRPLAPGRGAPVVGSLRFGGFYSAAGMMYFLAAQLDKVLVGRLLGGEALGLYGQAFNLMQKPVYVVTTPLTGVMLPALSRAGRDHQVATHVLSGCYRLTALVLLPVGVGLALVGHDAMVLLGGPQWRAAGPILSVLALAILGQGFINITGPIFSAAGRSDRQFYAAGAVTLVVCAAVVAGWWLGARQGNGTLGVAWGYTLAVIVGLALPVTRYCFRSMGHRGGPVAAAIARPAAAAAVMGAAVWSLKQMSAVGAWPPAVRLAACVALGAAIYGVLVRKDLRWLLRRPGR